VAVAIDASEVVDGADDRVSSYTYVLGTMDDVSKGGAEVEVALVVEVDGPGVPVDGACVDAIVLGNIVDVVPVNELFLDGFAEGVSADQAEPFVVSERYEGAFLHESEFFFGS
jgi:hypothetical protein